MASEGLYLPISPSASPPSALPSRRCASAAKPSRLLPSLSSNASARVIGCPTAPAPGASARLLQHDWPANARELSSVLEAAVVSSPDGLIRGEDLPIIPTLAPAPPVTASSLPDLNLGAVILDHIRLVLDMNRGNKLKTARQLGISRSTLYRLLAAASPSSN